MMLRGLTVGLLLGIAVVSARPSKETAAVHARSIRSVGPDGLKISKCVCDQNLDDIKKLIDLLGEIKCPSTSGNPNNPHEQQHGYLAGQPYNPGSPEQGNAPQSPPGTTYPHQPQSGSTYLGQSQQPIDYQSQPHSQGSFPGQYQPPSSYPGQPTHQSGYRSQPHPQSSYLGQTPSQSSYPGQTPSQISASSQSSSQSSYTGQSTPQSNYPSRTTPQSSHPGQNQPPSSYAGQTPNPYYSSSQHNSESGIDHPGATHDQIQPIPKQPSNKETGDYISNSSNSNSSKNIPSNSGSIPTKAETIEQDDNEQNKSSTTDTSISQNLQGANNTQVSNVTQITYISAPAGSTDSYPSTPQQPQATSPGVPSSQNLYLEQPDGYPEIPSNHTPYSPPENTGDVSQYSAQSATSNAPTENIVSEDGDQITPMKSESDSLHNVNAGDDIKNGNSELIDHIASSGDPEIEILEIDSEGPTHTLDDSKPQAGQPTQTTINKQQTSHQHQTITRDQGDRVNSAPTTDYQNILMAHDIIRANSISDPPPDQIQSDSTQIDGATTDAKNIEQETADAINFVQEQRPQETTKVKQNGNTQSPYLHSTKQPQLPYAGKHDSILQQSEKQSLVTNKQVAPTIINQQNSHQQTITRDQGDVKSTPTTNYLPELLPQDIPAKPIDDSTPSPSSIYNTPPISHYLHPNNSQETEILTVENFKKQTYPYIDEIEFSSNGDIMNYFDMKQISGVPGSYGGFNSHQSCTKNVYDKDVQALRNELNAQHKTLDRIVASLKKCRCDCLS